MIFLEFTTDEIQLFSLFSKLTGVEAVDLERTQWGLVFLVQKSDLGKAIGKQASTLQRVRTAMKQNVFIFPDSEELEEFVHGLFNNIEIQNIEVREGEGEKSIFLTVAEKDRGLAIGKQGMRVKMAKQLLKKKFNATISIRTPRTGIIEMPLKTSS